MEEVRTLSFREILSTQINESRMQVVTYLMMYREAVAIRGKDPKATMHNGVKEVSITEVTKARWNMLKKCLTELTGYEELYEKMASDDNLILQEAEEITANEPTFLEV